MYGVKNISGLFLAAVIRNLRAGKRYSSISVKVYCHFRHTDHYDSEILACDGPCGEWFHTECLGNEPVCIDKWHCNNCSKNQNIFLISYFDEQLKINKL